MVKRSQWRSDLSDHCIHMTLPSEESRNSRASDALGAVEIGTKESPLQELLTESNSASTTQTQLRWLGFWNAALVTPNHESARKGERTRRSVDQTAITGFTQEGPDY